MSSDSLREMKYTLISLLLFLPACTSVAEKPVVQETPKVEQKKVASAPVVKAKTKKASNPMEKYK